MVNVARRRLFRKHTEALHYIAHDRWLAGEKGPPSEISIEILSILPQDLWRVPLWIYRDGDEVDLLAESRSQFLLNMHHEGGQERARICAGRIDEGHGDNLAAIVGERNRPIVLRGQYKIRRGPNVRQLFRVIGCVMREPRAGTTSAASSSIRFSNALIFSARASVR